MPVSGRFLAIGLVLAACSTTPADVSPDASIPDAGAPPDAGALADAGPAVDAGTNDLDAGEPFDAGPSIEPIDAGPPPIPAACLALRDGTNAGFVVDGVAREFLLHLPSAVATHGAWPVVFAWHGRLQDPGDIDPLLSGRVNGPDYSFILVTPNDLDLPLPVGADWDNLQVASGASKDARLFDEVLSCLDQRFGVDRDRVHSVGFSAGAIMSDLLGVLRGDQMASLFTFSGAYFSNTQNIMPLASWPALTTSNRYVQFLTYGGLEDSSTGFNFALFAANDRPYLQANHHDTILCDHGGGHVLGHNPTGADVAKFFAAHPRGTSHSPWATLPAGLPALCLYTAGLP